MTKSTWQGRFPQNDIISLINVNRPLNLAESTSQDLYFDELIDLVGMDNLKKLRLGYGSSAGLPALREVVGEMCQVPADQVLITTGAALGLALIALECARPENGDEVVMATPCFPPARDLFYGIGATVREEKLTFDSGYGVDPEKIGRHMNTHTKLVYLATPNNPSGIQPSREEIAGLLAEMEKKAPDALLLIDETYRDATYGDDPVHYPDLMERLKVAKLNLVISGSPLDESLAAGLLQKAEVVLAPRRKLLAEGLNILESWHQSEIARLDYLRPHAGGLCCIRLRADVFDDAAVNRFWQILPDHDLQLADGSWFGETDRIFRLGFGFLPNEQLKEALVAISKALDESQP